MKLSVGLSSEEVAGVDEFARLSGLPSRSAVLQHVVRQLSPASLEQDYAAAWDEWEASGEQAAWDTARGGGMHDGASDATR